MRAPDFWETHNDWRACALAPLGALYGAVAAARLGRSAPRVELTTIAVGGVTLGGDGKTPTALALARLLQAQGERPAILTRGYGPSAPAAIPLRVDLGRHDARDVGDEALLLAAVAPTFVGADRLASAREAERAGASVLLLDDGFHSRRLEPDLAILVVDAAYGIGNGRCPPAGPLRAPLAAQLARADVVLEIGDAPERAGAAGRPRDGRPTVWRARLVPDPAAAARLSGRRLFAFAGIGRPQKFLASLREIGAEIVGARWFADHHVYSEGELSALAATAARLRGTLVTTEKDAARIGRRDDVEVLPVRLCFRDAAEVVSALAELTRRSS
jgi:tetraacyldisaccharide 4'-kinase